MPDPRAVPHIDRAWLRAEWTTLANDLDQYAAQYEQFAAEIRERAACARQKASDA